MLGKEKIMKENVETEKIVVVENNNRSNNERKEKDKTVPEREIDTK